MTRHHQPKDSSQILDMGLPISTEASISPSSNTADTGRSGGGSALFVRESKRIGKYQVVAELGRGGTASVCLAVARGKGGVRKLVVLKALLPELAEEPEAVSSFLDEARLAAQLNHPNVVQTYEVGTESGRHVIVMEYLDGQSLSRIIRTARNAGTHLTDALHLRILSEVLEGLHYAHELKAYDGHQLRLVHRDVSPQNVIVTYEGQVKILDFGIAKAASTSTHTAAGIMKGKIAYMAPEQMAGTVVDRRADIYSAGCMLWAAITGEKMWHDVPDVQVVRAVIAGKIPSPRTINPACPEELERIVMRALRPDPEERYATARELQSDLDQYAETLGRAAKSREIGRFVSQLFASSRSEFNENLERELATLLAGDDSSDPRDSMTSFGDGSSQFPGAPQVAELSSSIEASASGVQTTTKKHQWPLVAGAVFLGLCCVGLFYALAPVTKPSPRPTFAAPSLVQSAASVDGAGSTVSPVAMPTSATIRLAILPRHAKMTLDGRVLATETGELSLPIDDTTHELAVEAEGHTREVRSFKVTAPTTLTVNLEAKSDPKKVSKPTRVRVIAPSAPPAPTAVTPTKPISSSCENPFFVDAQGIKRVRPNCL